MTTYYAAVKWSIHATKEDIARTLQDDLELMILDLVEEKGFDLDTVWRYFEDAYESAAADLPVSDDDGEGDA